MNNTNVDVRLRPLRRDDFDRVLEMERVLFGSGAWSYGMLAEELSSLGRWYIVAEVSEPEAVGRTGAGRGNFHQTEGGHIVGYAGLWFDGEVAQVMTIGVDFAWQRRGVGRVMMAAILDRSRTLDAEAVWLEVAVDNESAIALYEELGFERVGLRRRYYQPEGTDAHTMRLPLKPSTPNNKTSQ
ncbi:MAG: GNAT family N-acetyltransferase [Promicromonosporaceae bacterium]|nr:GNAT family N-acetyltransferase [Promicromonosporaceae bacterium]